MSATKKTVARRICDLVVLVSVLLCLLASFAPPQTKAQRDLANEVTRQSQQIEDLRSANLPNRMTQIEDSVAAIKDRFGEFTWILRGFVAAAIAEIVRRMMNAKKSEDQVLGDVSGFALKADVEHRFDKIDGQLAALAGMITSHFEAKAKGA